ncbi:MAG: hypothetical protein ACLP36_16250 [Acidimicrobiales bacterium]
MSLSGGLPVNARLPELPDPLPELPDPLPELPEPLPPIPRVSVVTELGELVVDTAPGELVVVPC